MRILKNFLTKIKVCGIMGANRQVASKSDALRQICIDKSRKAW